MIDKLTRTLKLLINKDVCIVLKSGYEVQGEIKDVDDGFLYMISENKNMIIINEIALIKICEV